MITIKKATPNDSTVIAELAIDIYKENYLHLWHSGGAQWYMYEYAYSEEKLKMELDDSNVEYYIANENGSSIGYMKLVLTSTLSGYESMNTMEVERIYLFEKVKGRGIGKKLMELAQFKAQELFKDIVFLKAMDTSIDAIEFYKKMGYKICGSITLPLPVFSLMKKEYRGMVILMKKIHLNV